MSFINNIDFNFFQIFYIQIWCYNILRKILVEILLIIN